MEMSTDRVFACGAEGARFDRFFLSKKDAIRISIALQRYDRDNERQCRSGFWILTSDRAAASAASLSVVHLKSLLA